MVVICALRIIRLPQEGNAVYIGNKFFVETTLFFAVKTSKIVVNLIKRE